MVLTFTLVLIAALLWGFQSRLMFHSVKKDRNPTGFFGSKSYLRKYQLDYKEDPIPAKRTLYTKTFNVKYKERFFLSSTLLVFVTDFYHLSQFIVFKSLLLAIALQTENTLTVFLTSVVIWHVAFHLTFYKK